MLSNIEIEPKQNGVSDQCNNELIVIELKTHQIKNKIQDQHAKSFNYLTTKLHKSKLELKKPVIVF